MTDPNAIDISELRQLIHDLRNPLNRISMQTELAKMILAQDTSVQGNSYEQIVSALNKSLLSCQECSELLNDFANQEK